MVFNELIELLPEAKYLVVVRDPRAVVSSMLEVGKRSGRKNFNFTQNVFAAVQYINNCWDSGCKALEKPTTILVQYEDIVSKNTDGIQKIYSQLGLNKQEIRLSDSQFEYAEDMQSWDHWYTEEMLKDDIHLASIEKWKRQLKPYQIDYIENSISQNFISEIYFNKNLNGNERYHLRVKIELVLDKLKKNNPIDLIKNIF